MGLFTCIAATITCVAMFGYVFGVETAVGWGSYTRMAMHTAPTFFILSAGLLVWTCQQAQRDDFSFIRWLPVSSCGNLDGYDRHHLQSELWSDKKDRGFAETQLRCPGDSARIARQRLRYLARGRRWSR